MVTRILIALCLLATVAHGQLVGRKVLRRDLGAVTNGTGAVAWFTGEGSARNYYANDSTVSGSVLYRGGTTGNAMLFTNSIANRVTSSAPYIPASGDFTSAFTFNKTPGIVGELTLFSQYGSPYPAGRFLVNFSGQGFTAGGQNPFRVFVGNGFSLYWGYNNLGVTPIDAGRDFRFTLTRIGNTFTLYGNGIAITNATYAGNIQNTATEFGAEPDSTAFHGTLDNIEIYHVAKTPAGVRADYFLRRPTQ